MSSKVKWNRNTNDNPTHVVIPWWLAVSLTQILHMDLELASICEGQEVTKEERFYNAETNQIIEAKTELTKAIDKAREDLATPDFFKPQKTYVEWHKYPDERPPKLNAWWLVKIRNDNNSTRVRVANYSWDCARQEAHFDDGPLGWWPDERIVEWAVLPE